jgi:regulation of enolase protein 1 (concanavalin A-like superfamily)
VWKGEWQQPIPNPAGFALKPAALNTSCVGMIATRGQSELGSVEYRFTETSGQTSAHCSGWVSAPFFIQDGLQPNTRYSYSVVMRDPFGNVTAPSPAVETVTAPSLFQSFADKFDVARDFLSQGASGTIWDGVLGKAEESAPEAIAARDGVLRLQSKGTVWDGGKPLGAFLFKVVPGDFVVQVKVVDYAGLETRKVPGNNDGGLMVRVPNVNDAGPGEDLVQLNFFPIWNQGNMVTTLDGGRLQKGNQLAWNAHRFLQIIRQGNLFYFRTSSDGTTWKHMPGSPVEREDMAGLPLQVGLYHASYGGESSHVAFSDFQLTVRK